MNTFYINKNSIRDNNMHNEYLFCFIELHNTNIANY